MVKTEGVCTICYSHTHKLWWYHYMRYDEAGLWYDAGIIVVCGECATSPKRGWKRIG